MFPEALLTHHSLNLSGWRALALSARESIDYHLDALARVDFDWLRSIGHWTDVCRGVEAYVRYSRNAAGGAA